MIDGAKLVPTLTTENQYDGSIARARCGMFCGLQNSPISLHELSFWELICVEDKKKRLLFSSTKEKFSHNTVLKTSS